MHYQWPTSAPPLHALSALQYLPMSALWQEIIKVHIVLTSTQYEQRSGFQYQSQLAVSPDTTNERYFVTSSSVLNNLWWTTQ